MDYAVAELSIASQKVAPLCDVKAAVHKADRFISVGGTNAKSSISGRIDRAVEIGER
ncbi:hypothetical protein [Sulfitobacter sp. W074]|uniref:hypothetical protein n=1 Tax=Sulfitobacter sp. W074 TaxID=2867026 RepID=UPI0021A34F00|nr:hypothetical protein [Sulfitobacter sp. W074]UWR36176.1 hypothetical protein K3762_10175 [Sulfitobacter sp. W074]|tara:strand:+ start:955 stop:1125 length:171 start_codon:yes stop_codon:yes gene_type:complete